MKFKINNSNWEIRKVSEQEMLDISGNINTVGITQYRDNIIYIKK